MLQFRLDWFVMSKPNPKVIDSLFQIKKREISTASTSEPKKKKKKNKRSKHIDDSFALVTKPIVETASVKDPNVEVVPSKNGLGSLLGYGDDESSDDLIEMKSTDTATAKE
jgi:hypothetical protein